MQHSLLDAITEMQENPTGNSLYKLLRTFHSTTRSGFVWDEVIAVIEKATGEWVDPDAKIKKFTRHIRKPGAFFHGLEKGELFTYSFSTMMYRDVEQEAAKHGVTIQYMPPGTPEYKKYGCTTCKRVK
jgi:hypothetical protein